MKRAELTFFIHHISNSWGHGYEIRAEILLKEGGLYETPRRSYYGYDINTAKRLYRAEFGLKGKHSDSLIW